MSDIPEEIYVIPANEQMGIQFVGWDFLSGDTKAEKYIRADLVPQWHPIETAPRDGSYIILYRPSNDGRHKDAVREGKYHRYGMSDTWRVRSGGVWDIDAPTHWMPMPQPPKGE